MSLARERKSPTHSLRDGASVQARKKVVEEEAGARLRCSAYRDIRGVTCEFHEGVLTLRGRVQSYYMKQIAQSLVLRMGRVEEINNRLEVESHAGYL